MCTSTDVTLHQALAQGAGLRGFCVAECMAPGTLDKHWLVDPFLDHDFFSEECRPSLEEGAHNGPIWVGDSKSNRGICHGDVPHWLEPSGLHHEECLLEAREGVYFHQKCFQSEYHIII